MRDPLGTISPLLRSVETHDVAALPGCQQRLPSATLTVATGDPNMCTRSVCSSISGCCESALLFIGSSLLRGSLRSLTIFRLIRLNLVDFSTRYLRVSPSSLRHASFCFYFPVKDSLWLTAISRHIEKLRAGSTRDSGGEARGLFGELITISGSLSSLLWRCLPSLSSVP